jgi:hypothetical protein
MDEIEVKQQATTLEQQAQDYQIATNDDYEQGAEFLKRVKGTEKEVKSYWKPAKDAAAKAHKEICQKEKAMLSICESAEKILKGKMLSYSQKVEADRRAAEEAARKAAQEESDRLLAEAAKAEKSGDSASATVNMAMAEQMENVKPAVQIAAPKVTGVSKKKVWKVRVDDEKAVPSYANGICIRPVDERAIMQLHRLNPNVEIPGVTFFQTEQLAVR